MPTGCTRVGSRRGSAASERERRAGVGASVQGEVEQVKNVPSPEAEIVGQVENYHTDLITLG